MAVGDKLAESGIPEPCEEIACSKSASSRTNLRGGGRAGWLGGCRLPGPDVATDGGWGEVGDQKQCWQLTQ